jgi:hypothetical protein
MEQTEEQKKQLSEARLRAIEKMKEGKKMYDAKRREMQSELELLREKQQSTVTREREYEQPRDEEKETHESENVNASDYMYIPKAVWEEQKTYISKLKTKLKEQKYMKPTPFAREDDDSVLNTNGFSAFSKPEPVPPPAPLLPQRSMASQRILQSNQLNNARFSRTREIADLKSKIMQ